MWELLSVWGLLGPLSLFEWELLPEWELLSLLSLWESLLWLLFFGCVLRNGSCCCRGGAAAVAAAGWELRSRAFYCRDGWRAAAVGAVAMELFALMFVDGML